MSITPTGGWDIHNNRGEAGRATWKPEDPQGVVLRPEPPPAPIQSGVWSADGCPSCGSTDWRFASLVYSEGLTTTRGWVKGRTIGVGRVGLRNGQFVATGGTFSGQTRGTSQTLLSSMAAPPRKRNGLIVFLFFMGLLFGIASANNITPDGVVYPAAWTCGAVALLSFLGMIKLWMRQRETYETAMEAYVNTKMCQRCGTFYN